MFLEQSPVTTAGRKQIILVVDDDPNNLAVVRDSLLELDYTILVAEDGESAVQRAAYAQPDLILLDIMMPGIDGYETCCRLKSMESTKEIPVIFMTALAETVHKVNGLEAGAVDYITKPFQREELLARIAVHLHNRELTKKLRDANELLETRVAERTEELAQTIIFLNDEIVARERSENERLRLATAIEQASEAIFMADALWRFTYVNPAFERLSGFSRTEVMGRDTAMLRSRLKSSADYDQIREIIAREGCWSGHILTGKKDGSFFEAETTVSAVRDSKGYIINYVFILRDITNELKLERELRQSQKMEAIGTLAGGIAHDFNNILAAIIGYTELAQSHLSQDDAAAKHLEKVQLASSRAKDLVRRILTFSRQKEQELMPVPLAATVEEVLKLLRPSLPATIEICRHISTAPNDDVILADQTQIHQVLMNLGTNAAHAMQAGGGVLTFALANIAIDNTLLALHPGLKKGPGVMLTVSDTGQGIGESIRERIFDPYFTTKNIGEGTGVGLSVVQSIVENLGGVIRVQSKVHEGSTFEIILPKYAEEPMQQTSSAHALPSGGTERILFVDDEAILVEIGKELLGSLGYCVTVSMKSSDALTLFRKDPRAFDLLITDMTMPGLTGLELARECLALRPAIPIVLCTGYSNQISEKKAKEAGIKEFIMKPYELKSLDLTIRRALAAGPGEMPAQ